MHFIFIPIVQRGLIAVIGSSDSNSKTIKLNDGQAYNTCPSTVNSENRIKLGYVDATDTWSVEQNRTHITVKRTDKEDRGWGLDLRFVCHEPNTFSSTGKIFSNYKCVIAIICLHLSYLQFASSFLLFKRCLLLSIRKRM